MSSISIPKLLKLKDYITLIGTTLGIIALICACTGSRAIISLGFFLISITLGTDLIDGYIARKTKTVNEMGKELDSLSDSLTFGIAPAILTFQAFKTNTIFDIVILIGAICFVFGAILRLARFNISEVPGYTGVPTPISALLLIAYFYLNYFFAFGMGGNSYPFPLLTSYLIPVLMFCIAWFNITTYIRFGEKGKIIYLIFIIVAPLCPILGIIGILNPNPTTSMIVSVFFLAAFILLLTEIARGFFLHIKRKKS
ncbi:MAG: CDP-alcohol phosphatidyltransferase family protein [Promethearchaeota archaeon]|jgi:CDP-diacylglycerol--serine O-phosphatidyltransferase